MICTQCFKKELVILDLQTYCGCIKYHERQSDLKRLLDIKMGLGSFLTFLAVFILNISSKTICCKHAYISTIHYSISVWPFLNWPCNMPVLIMSKDNCNGPRKRRGPIQPSAPLLIPRACSRANMENVCLFVGV